MDNWLIDAELMYGRSESDTETRYSGYFDATTGAPIRTKGDFDSDHYGANLYLGYAIEATDWLRVTPFIGAEYYHGSHDSYTETQYGNTMHFSPFNRHISAEDYDSFRTPIGLRFAGAFELGDTATLIPELSLAYSHEFGDEAGEIKARLAGGSTEWTAESIEPGRDAFLLDAALGVAVNENVEFSLSYGLEARDEYLENRGQVQVGIKF